jgi:formate dehydrogenase major subunit
MKLSRRAFLKLGGFTTAGVLAFDPSRIGVGPIGSVGGFVAKKRIGEKATICPYDASGCGFLVSTENGRQVHIEGDPDHPINRGAACSKGASMAQLSADNPRRLSKVLYRKPGGTEWEEKNWDWALREMAKRIKKTRDDNWTEKDGHERIVNHTEAIGNFGGSALDNEECYLLVKMARALGLLYIEHHARI